MPYETHLTNYHIGHSASFLFYGGMSKLILKNMVRKEEALGILNGYEARIYCGSHLARRRLEAQHRNGQESEESAGQQPDRALTCGMDVE